MAIVYACSWHCHSLSAAQQLIQEHRTTGLTRMDQRDQGILLPGGDCDCICDVGWRCEALQEHVQRFWISMSSCATNRVNNVSRQDKQQC